jgi:hypothetical protein
LFLGSFGIPDKSLADRLIRDTVCSPSVFKLNRFQPAQFNILKKQGGNKYDCCNKILVPLVYAMPETGKVADIPEI